MRLRCGLELSVDGRSIVDGDARRRRVRRCGQTQQYRCSSRCLCAGEDSSLSPATTSSTMTASGGLSHWAATHRLHSCNKLHVHRIYIAYTRATKSLIMLRRPVNFSRATMLTMHMLSSCVRLSVCHKPVLRQNTHSFCCS